MITTFHSDSANIQYRSVNGIIHVGYQGFIIDLSAVVDRKTCAEFFTVPASNAQYKETVPHT